MESKDVEHDVQPEVTAQTVGAILREARIRSGLSLEQVASKINLRAHNIEDLEQDKVDPSVSLTFTRGYIKLYARLVGLNEADTIAIFDKTTQLPQKETAKLQSFSKKVAKEASDQKLMAVTWIIVAVIIGLFVVWAVQQTGWNLPLLSDQPKAGINANTVEVASESEEALVIEDATDTSLIALEEATGTVASQGEAAYDIVAQTSEETAAQSLSEQSREIADAEQVEANDILLSQDEELADKANSNSSSDLVEASLDDANNDEALSQDLELNEVVSDDIDSSVSNDESATQDEQALLQQAPGVVTPQDLVEMVFEFSADCWVNISDATGEDIAFGVKQEGKVMTLTGVPPIEVVLGAPSAVSITYDGEAIDMTQFPASRTARFELPILN